MKLTPAACSAGQAYSAITQGGAATCSNPTAGDVQCGAACVSDAEISDLSPAKLSGAATANRFLRSNGTNWVSAQIQAADVPDLSATYVNASSGVAPDSNKLKGATVSGGPTAAGQYLRSSGAGAWGVSGGIPAADVTGATLTIDGGDNGSSVVQTNGSLVLRMDRNANDTAPQISFQQGTGAFAMSVMGNGNVGIGSAAPAATLTVNGHIRTQIADNSPRFSELWTASAQTGVATCDSACGNGFCLGAYADDNTNTKSSCSATTPNRVCICVGHP